MPSESRCSFYLVQLSYAPAALDEILAKGDSFDARMQPVRDLAAKFHGSFARYEFDRVGDGGSVVVREKFVPFAGGDIVAVMAFTDAGNARAFSSTIAAEPGVKSITLTPMLPLEDFTTTLAATRQHRDAYAAPGRGSP